MTPRILLDRARRSLKAIVTSLAIFLAATTTASAMRVAPMVAEITTSGAGSIARIEVGNVGSAVLPFEATITRVELDSSGKVIESAGDEDFLVFPPQGLVAVGGRQVIRVQWVGPPLEQSRAYYLSVRQLAVPTDPDSRSDDTPASIAVSVLYNMKALLLVTPPGVKPNVEVTSAVPILIAAPEGEVELTEAEAGEPDTDPSASAPTPAVPAPSVPGIEVVVTNTGDRYALMSGARWIVEGTDLAGQPFSRTYTGGEISQALGVGYLPAGGGRRVFKLATGTALDPQRPVNVRFMR